MIELRWAQRIGKNLKVGPQTVLEYRFDPSCGLGHWTEWQRVPTVWLGRSDAAGERDK